jgi:hypothetical protein
MDGPVDLSMAKRTLFTLIELPFCQAVLFENWNAAPGRFFVAYHTRGAFTALLGAGVVDEFHTISGPIMLCPSSILGGIYDAGMRLADARDIEANIDQGWPPLTVGVDVAAPARPDDWMDQLLLAMQTQTSFGKAPWRHTVRVVNSGDYGLQILQCSVARQAVVTILATDAPLLPQQLHRLADLGTAPVSIAIATGNRLPRVAVDELQQLSGISEQLLADLLATARRATR